MRKTFLFILWALSFLPLSAQQGGALPADKAREVMQKLTRTASEMGIYGTLLQCAYCPWGFGFHERTAAG